MRRPCFCCESPTTSKLKLRPEASTKYSIEFPFCPACEKLGFYNIVLYQFYQ